jgi:hypothetical protein
MSTKTAAGLDAHVSSTNTEFPRKRFSVRSEDDAIMSFELRQFRRNVFSLYIGRCGDGDDRDGGEFAHDQGGIGQRSVVDRNVEAARDEILDLGCRSQFKIDIGILGEERLQLRDEI